MPEAATTFAGCSVGCGQALLRAPGEILLGGAADRGAEGVERGCRVLSPDV